MSLPSPPQTLTGSASVSGNIVINATGVFFNNTGANTVANPLTPGSSNTGSFAGLSNGAIQNLPGATVPGPLAIKNFASFNTPSGTVIFDLQSIAPGVGSSSFCALNAIGDVCTPSGSPFTLLQTSPLTVAIQLTLNGTAYLAAATPGSTPSPAFLSIQTVMAARITDVVPVVATAAGVHNPYSAALTITSP